MSYRIFNTLVFSLTNQCNSRCKFCIVKAGTAKEKKQLDENVIKKVLQEISKINTIRTVAFTGGEVFEDFDKLVRLTKSAQLNKKEVVIYTNSFWSIDYTITLERLKVLKRCGLSKILTSIDYEHQKYIPVNNQRYLLKVCGELGIPVGVHCVVQKSTLHSTFDILKDISDDLIGVSITVSSVMPIGDAEYLDESQDLFNRINSENARCGFDNMAHVNVNGEVYPCCMGDVPKHFLLGNVYNDSILYCLNNAVKNIFFRAYLNKGFSWLFNLAIKENLIESDKLYTDGCEMCKKLFSSSDDDSIIQFKIAIEKELCNI